MLGKDAGHSWQCTSHAQVNLFSPRGPCSCRTSGASDEPMPSPPAVAFQSPPSLAVEMQLPNRGVVTGMGIPLGVTLIVGGGFHGKSTLLKALEMGVYNKASLAANTCTCKRLWEATQAVCSLPYRHLTKGVLSCAVFSDAPAAIPASHPQVPRVSMAPWLQVPGDGRELVATDASAVKIRAEDGRAVQAVDISPFIKNLPFGESGTAVCAGKAVAEQDMHFDHPMALHHVQHGAPQPHCATSSACNRPLQPALHMPACRHPA